MTINASAEQVQTLFASDYVQGGANHILGFTHQRATWQGRVVAYQPCEYQPNALDDLDGNNFQILGNALLFAADAVIIPTFVNFCSGDGGNQMGCTNCPCANNAPAGTIGGCLNSANTSTQLVASGDTSVTLPAGIGTDLRFDLTGAPSASFCILSARVVTRDRYTSPMKDWEEQLAAREAEFGEWNAGYDKALRKLLKERGLNSFFKEPAQAELESAAHDARKTAGNDVPVAMFGFIDTLGEHFMNSRAQERGLIRARVGASNALFPFLWSYILQSPELITSASDGPRLRAALAGVCIDDARAEFDALHELLAELYIAAARAGIDASPYFADAAEVASKSAAGGGTFLRSILAEFDTSIWFNERVKAQPGAEWFRPRAS